MPFQSGKSGNPGGKAKDQDFHNALQLEIKAAGGDHKMLRAIARNLLTLSLEPSQAALPAIKEVANRLDGMPVQQIASYISEHITVIRAPPPELSASQWATNYNQPMKLINGKATKQ